MEGWGCNGWHPFRPSQPPPYKPPPLPSLHPLPLFQITSSNLKDRNWREMIETKYPSKKAENLDAALARVVDLF